jgi:hypothetical protein
MENFDIESLPILVQYIGETIKDSGWQCDEWRVTLSNKSGSWSTSYFTGLGHRNKKNKKPVKPSKASILESLFLDASAANSNFIDWCNDIGYNDDSMHAFSVYKECIKTGIALRKYFTAQERKAIESHFELI